jgi:tRNA A-37 threonylcarbamoyl transferase component Bud32
MDSYASVSPADARTGENKMTPASLEGQTLGRYRVLEQLGRGGMAQVYRAYHPQLDRYVAIKVMRPDLADDEEFLVRFRREARAVAALRHSNIVQVFDFDVQNDVSFMVMELLEGDTLKTRLADYRARGEQMPLGEVARVLIDVLDGLAYAHGEGMIHRDIKPANILLTRRGQAVIADFGVAQIVGGTRYTLSGALLGTLNYMAPEQGMEGKSDARSDIYSLGIVLYEMLTQRTPFDADTPLAILMKHLNDPLPLPRQVNPAIPEPFERIVLKALAKRPDERYQSAAEMAEALHEAATAAGVELPACISLPLSFATAEAPAESVAVLSGTAREHITDAGFAVDDTQETAGQRAAGQASESGKQQLASALGALGQALAGKSAYALNVAAAAMEGKPAPAAEETGAGSGREFVSALGALGQAVAGKTAGALNEAVAAIRGEPLPEQAAGEAVDEAESVPGERLRHTRRQRRHQSARGRRRLRGQGGAIVAAALLIPIVNVAMAWWGGLTGNWDIFGRGWPVEVFLVGMLLATIMVVTSSIWLLIPAGIVIGNGLVLAYCSITGLWSHWICLWPLEPLLVGGTIWVSVALARRGEHAPRLARALGGGLVMFAIIWGVITGLIAAFL